MGKRHDGALQYDIRPGCRGGTTDFKWDDAKTDKYRENYLGNSINAATGRWQHGKDLKWWNEGRKQLDLKGADDLDIIKIEKAAIKLREKEMRLEALGVIPKRDRRERAAMDKATLEEVLKRGETTRDVGFGEIEGERVVGLGYGIFKEKHHAAETEEMFMRNMVGSAKEAETRLEGNVADSDDRSKNNKDSDRRRIPIKAGTLSMDQLKLLRQLKKQDKKVRKEEKRARKVEKKALKADKKRRKKERKHVHGQVSRSRSRSASPKPKSKRHRSRSRSRSRSAGRREVAPSSSKAAMHPDRLSRGMRSKESVDPYKQRREARQRRDQHRDRDDHRSSRR